MNRLLIFAPNWLGDAVMALPAIADVRRGAPESSITVAARPSIAPLFGLVSEVNQVITLSVKQPMPDISAWWELGAQLRDKRFAAALLLPNSFHAALVAARAGIPDRWGYRSQWRGPLLTRAIDRPPSDVHQVEYYQQLVHALGFSNGPTAPQLDVSSGLREAGARILGDAGWDRHTPLVALAPGAAYGGAKRWSAESFAELAQALARDGIGVVIVGSASDVSAGQPVADALPGGSAFNLIGRTDLPALAGILSNCRALVGNDSGATHLGAALGVRVTAVFGPTDERVSGPRGEIRPKTDATHAVLTYAAWCRPCMLRECPLDHRCMRGVDVAAVLATARQAL